MTITNMTPQLEAHGWVEALDWYAMRETHPELNLTLYTIPARVFQLLRAELAGIADEGTWELPHGEIIDVLLLNGKMYGPDEDTDLIGVFYYHIEIQDEDNYETTWLGLGDLIEADDLIAAHWTRVQEGLIMEKQVLGRNLTVPAGSEEMLGQLHELIFDWFVQTMMLQASNACNKDWLPRKIQVVVPSDVYQTITKDRLSDQAVAACPMKIRGFAAAEHMKYQSLPGYRSDIFDIEGEKYGVMHIASHTHEDELDRGALFTFSAHWEDGYAMNVSVPMNEVITWWHTENFAKV